jgi:hypothetical protein
MTDMGGFAGMTMCGGALKVDVIPAKAGIQWRSWRTPASQNQRRWIPAFAGMTK